MSRTVYFARNEEGALISIHDVKKRYYDSWKYYCLSCGKTLIARKGDVNIHHFAHKPNESCNGSFESDLHIYVKNLILTKKYLALPVLNERTFHENIIHPFTLSFDDVFLERKYENIDNKTYIADVVGVKGSKTLYIEIEVSNKVKTNSEKQLQIIMNKLSTLRINLSSLKRNDIIENIDDYILNDISNKSWVFNNKYLYKTKENNEIYLNPKLNKMQINELIEGANNGLTQEEIMLYDDHRFNENQMEVIRVALEDKMEIDKVKQFCKKSLTDDQMWEIYSGFRSNLETKDVLFYLNAKIHWKRMKLIRLSLENSIEKDFLEVLANNLVELKKVDEILESIENGEKIQKALSCMDTYVEIFNKHFR